MENQRINLLSEANSLPQSHQIQTHEHLEEYQQGVRHHLAKVEQEAKDQQVASREDVGTWRHELPQSLAEESQCQNCVRRADLVRPEVHHKFSSCDMSVNI